MGMRNLPDITCWSDTIFLHYHKSFHPGGLNPQGALTNSALKVKSQTKSALSCCRADLGFQHEKQHEKNADVSGLWFFLFPFPAYSLKKIFKLFLCTRKAQRAEMFLTRQLSEMLKVWGTKLSGPAGQLTASLTERQTEGNSTSFISFWQKCGWEHRVPVRAHICFQPSLTTSGTTNKVEVSLTPGQQPQRCCQAVLQVFIAGGREEHKHFGFSAVIASPDHHTHSPQAMTQ